ncbi:MAG: 2-C-methyl-D-erythritol 2,4-cyclodiphosphate synthase [Haloplasmataceae bacterium]|jgi:2-C-methyl-D-erythritol 2,4-cyclodiphosphate synthase|nr:2-C-methyl-D-erythritol 2,4-cyclodiphosphate synthase [Haloplasmataceae bacterium]
MILKIGHSTDIHQLVENRDLILGGVKIEHHKGLLGHSDADALLHAITEAIIGALGLGDIGKHFPDTDNQYKGIDSKVLLKKAFELAKDRGYRINNLDTTIFAEKPKMAPYISKMREVIANILETDVENVNVKATRGEKIGFVGREEGIVCEAVVLLIK